MLIRLFILLVLLVLKTIAFGQSNTFSHLNTSNGLSDNTVRSLAIDRNGFLWIGTSQGLNLYDGYAITVFNKERYPAIASDNISHLTCDSKDRLWIGSNEGASYIDAQRNIQRVLLNDTISRYSCASIMETTTLGNVLFTNLGQFYFNTTEKKWRPLYWIQKQLDHRRFLDAEQFDGDKVIYTTDSLVLILDYASKTIIYEQPFSKAVSACRVSEHEIAVGILTGLVQIVDIRTKKITRQYQLTNDLNGQTINTTLTEVRRASNGHLLVATGFAGLITINELGQVTRYTHQPINPLSIAGNNAYRVLCSERGDVVVGTTTAGVSIFNIFSRQAASTRVFYDDKGNFFDGHITKIAEAKNGKIWLGAQDRLIYWDRVNNKSSFYHYYFNHPQTGVQSMEVRTLCIDQKDRLWAGILGPGLAILNQSTGQFELVKKDSALSPAVSSGLVLDLFLGSDGYVWVATVAGFYRIHPDTKKVDAFNNHPQLKKINHKRINTFTEDKQGRIWLGTFSDGLFCYDSKKDTLLQYSNTNGFLGNYCVSVYHDKRGNIYTGTLDGLNVIDTNGRLYTYAKKHGLRYDRCDGFVEDEKGKIWIANFKCLLKFDFTSKTFRSFDDNVGLSPEGFRVNSGTILRSNEIMWGTQHGINYFYSNQLVNYPSQVRVNIYRADVKDSVIRGNHTEPLVFNYDRNDIVFYFTAINLTGSRNIRYRYLLEGFDKDWQEGTDIRQVRYPSLPAGNYTFKVKASSDRINWIDSNNFLKVEITPPIWQRWWFITACTLVVCLVVYWLTEQKYKQQLQQKEELETEQAINYFASTMYEQQSVETILWDVAKNCIGRLQFEDCVIYMLDEDRNVLIQKAAHGPKSSDQFEIAEPLEIPVGRGIVGSVAASGKAEIVEDTTKDPRYIIDDERRYSEISVPIKSDDKVLGVIDCEHSKKGFFTQKHLSILNTIASLCANKIVKARAEEEKEKAQLILMDTQRKMSEVEMQALRAQMNPHFIFNCLNSINRYIVKSDQATASLYLTRFAKLIRLILDNSNSKNVILSNELEALKLYVEMEGLRFDRKFTYRMTVDANVNADSVEVPPLIIQPYVENAIWHGLLHKESGGQLNIHVSMDNPGVIQCVIEDNGVGREKAGELKSKSATTRKSLGMKLTEDRIALLNRHSRLNASVDIIDLKTSDDQAAGTKVILTIPVY